jgi:predicted secreted acid phosphatase
MSSDRGKQAEFYTDKPKTIICDLDGTILKHAHVFSDLDKYDPQLNPGVIDKLNYWDSLGHTIVLMTARKESAREMTEKHLRSLGVMWDHLIMGVTSGKRVLINDKLELQDPDRAVAVNVITDLGFNNTDWEGLGL